MPKSNKTTQPVVAYLKVSSYYKSYLQSKYGEIVSFPFISRLYATVSQGIVPNKTMTLLTPFSFSQTAFECQRDDSLFDININLPGQEDRKQFVPIEIPGFVLRGRKEIKTDAYWQFSKSGAVAIRKLITQELWIDCLEFVRECAFRAHVSGIKFTRENAILDFMTVHDIDVSWYESMIRYDQRYRQQILKDIERKRALMEELSDRQFCYT